MLTKTYLGFYEKEKQFGHKRALKHQSSFFYGLPEYYL